jgi:hypothetical protein
MKARLPRLHTLPTVNTLNTFNLKLRAAPAISVLDFGEVDPPSTVSSGAGKVMSSVGSSYP